MEILSNWIFWKPYYNADMEYKKQLQTKESNIVVDYKITFLTDKQRTIFLVIYLIVFAVSMTANVSTILVTFKRNMRSLQKTWIVSLALSDIIVAIFLGANNVVMLSHRMNNWILGEFMCPFVPYMQNMGQLANSITMALIAYDRYRNIIHSLNKQWDPRIWVCVIVFITIWIFPAAIVIPQWYITQLKGPFRAILTNPHNRTQYAGEEKIYFCMYGYPKERNLIFYIIIACVIFIPLMCLSLWLYFKIAQLIWKRRRPPAERYIDNNTSVTLDTSTGETRTSVKSVKRMKSIMKSSKLHVEKKVRTFKIILVIMFVFFLCRMPYWINNVYRFSQESASKSSDWILSYSFSLVLVINTAINPFLYSFLNQTIVYFDKFFVRIGDFVSKICCYCCSDFDDYRREEINESVCEQRASQSSNILPRGPYIVNCNTCKNHVKFDDVAVVNTYDRDVVPFQYNQIE